MKRALLPLLVALGMGCAAAVAQTAKRPIGLDDMLAWKTIQAVALSPNGQWFAYVEDAPVGDGSAVFRQTHGATVYRFDLGEPPLPPARGLPRRAGFGDGTAIRFSSDGRFGAYLAFPTHAQQADLRKQHKPSEMHAGIVNLATGKETAFARVRRFAFSGSNPDWIAILKLPPAAANGGRGATAGSAGPSAEGQGQDQGQGQGQGGNGSAGSTAPKYTPGTDLILRNLRSGENIDIGNVGDFAFDRQGRYLAWTASTPDKSGNGVEYRDLRSGAVRSLDSDPGAVYTQLKWNEKGTALAVLRGTDATGFQDRHYDVVGFTSFGPEGATKVVFAPGTAVSFPKGFAVSPNRAPAWTEKLDALLFGIQKMRPVAGKTPDAAESVDLEIWNYQDPRLQSQQIVQEKQDRNFSYLCEYRPATKTFIRLADETVKNVTPAPHDRYAIGTSIAPYELESHLDGQPDADIYAIDLATGRRTLALQKARWGEQVAPDGIHFAYYRDGNWYVYDMATGASRNLTATVATSFVNTEDDHNLKKPPVPFVGWSRNSRDLLLSDDWDIWRVPINGSAPLNLTGDGKTDGIRYRNPVNFDLKYHPTALGFDLSKPLYLNAYGEWTKQDGIAVVQPGRVGARRITFDAALYGALSKAKNAPVYLYRRQTYAQPADFYATGASFSPGVKLTDLEAQVKPFLWTSGTILVNYVGYGGVRLQGALHLPPDFVKGRQYPTIVEFYEKTSQNAYAFIRPAVQTDGFNIAEYLSNGYAVFDPDIHYKVDDPGISSSVCLENAVEAAIATGVPDPKHIGIHGHSWGGYQTAFVITQTHIFAAAVAGAPLTDMISMYGIIYKNAGITNGQIFEASQGRFSGPPFDLWAAYTRNSPIYGVENVTTPLLMVADVGDGAVDFTQGMEYFNDLRRAHKRVVLLDYPSQNHELAKRADQIDYTVRMKQFFDHFLEGAPLPEWYAKGVPALRMKSYLKGFVAKYEQ